MKQVFISYSRHNLDVITQLIEDLQAVGVSIWYDQTLTGGQRWWDNILANIRECDIFVFALSPESWDSEACKSELSYVAQLGKPILPVLVSDGINLNLLSAPLNEIQVTDYRRRDKEAAFALVKSINTTPPSSPLPDPLPTAPTVPISYLSTLKERIDSAEPLNSDAQIRLLFDLETELRQGRSPAEIRDLFLRLKRRDELLARVATEIDTALKSIDEKINQLRESSVSKSFVPDNMELNRGVNNDRTLSKPKPCSQCGKQIGAASKFCPECGAPLAQTDEADIPSIVPDESGRRVERSEVRRYMCTSNDLSQLISDVKNWLDSQGFDSQRMNTEDQTLLLQIKKRGGWRDFVGMATSLNILFCHSNDTLTVEIGAGKWIDKAAVGTVSMFILWPLAITAGYGIWEQMKMPDKIFDYIGARLVGK